MATKRFKIDGYGQLELNNVAFRRDGRIESQCKAADDMENGMVVQIEKAKKLISFYEEDNDAPLGLIYSAEHIYDQRTPGLKNYLNEADGFLPRVGYLAVGDLWTTNTLAYDDTLEEDAVKALVEKANETPVYAVPDAGGAVLLTATKPAAGAYMEVVKPFTMPDGQYAVQLRVIKL